MLSQNCLEMELKVLRREPDCEPLLPSTERIPMRKVLLQLTIYLSSLPRLPFINLKRYKFVSRRYL